MSFTKLTKSKNIIIWYPPYKLLYNTSRNLIMAIAANKSLLTSTWLLLKSLFLLKNDVPEYDGWYGFQLLPNYEFLYLGIIFDNFTLVKKFAELY